MLRMEINFKEQKATYLYEDEMNDYPDHNTYNLNYLNVCVADLLMEWAMEDGHEIEIIYN